MSTTVQRTCTEIPSKDDSRFIAGDTETLSAYRSTPAYVLLGDPGSGKTTEFRKECEELGDTAVFVTARSFVADVYCSEELHGRTLFIDGLDEMRAGATDARVPLDEIRRRLIRLGRPSFRISCREADWLGPNDRQSLEAVSLDSTIRVLLLDQLSLQAICELLAEEIGVDNAEAFKNEAEGRGLGAMLRNPQTLKLLTKAVGPGGTWPDSRLETLELACQEMAAEYNDEHRHAGGRHPAEAILDAAGHLCALLMLCGFEGYELTSGDLAADSGARGLAPLDDLGDTSLVPSREVLKAALATNLFRPEGETGRVPSHRLIAEFLAGRYLAELIERGLPARRVVALMTGLSDGRVVTALRGLSAWLAARPGEARRQLIDADPVGVGLYGDIEGFTLHDRERLLRSLVEFAAQGPLFGHAWQDDRALGYGDDTARTFRSLASADMLESIRSVLLTPVGQPQRDRTTAFMVEVLSEARGSEKESLIPLVPDLRTIMRDPDRPPWVTARVLDAYIRIAPPSEHSAQVLVEQLAAIRDEMVPDPGEGMRVTLLEHLYPTVIGAAEVWRCGLPRPGANLIGSLSSFWHLRVLPEYSDECMAELLDALSEDAQRLVPALAHSYLDDLPVQLLARGLRAFGDTLDVDRLFGWLNVAGNTQRAHSRSEDDSRFVRTWLESRPQEQKAVFLLWLRRQVLDEPDRTHRFWACDALHRSKLPANFGLWCLNQAMMLENSEPALAQGLLSQAYEALADPSIRNRLTLAGMRDRVGTGLLAQKLEELHSRHSATRTDDGWRQRMEERIREQDEKEERRREDWARDLRSQLDDLRDNRLFPPNLHTLAKVYLGMFTDVDDEASPRQRVRDFIGTDVTLVDAVMGAIRGAILRDDLPEADETIALHLESKHSWLAYPALASLHLLDAEDPACLDRISEDRKRKSLAIHYCVPSGDEFPPWYSRWFRQEPELVLEALLQCAVPAIRAGDEFVPCLNLLDRLGGRDDPAPVLAFNSSTGLFEARPPTPCLGDHDDLVHDTRLRLLDAVPTRTSNKQMRLLDGLVARAMQDADKAPLREVAARKLSLRSLTVSQRTRWLAVDALLSGRANLEPLKEYVSQNAVRVRHLAEFLHCTSRRDDMRQSALAGVREPEVLKDAIEILGPSFGPVERGGSITLGMEMSELLAVLIAQLSTLAGDDTDRAFRDLIDDPLLDRWYDQLVSAHERQHVVHRDASYRHPGIDEVQRTLSRGAPANAADLAALLQDRFADISADAQGSDSNPWKKYWNVDPHGRPTEARPENSCRDVLVEALRDRLPAEVTLAPESLYAADNRADIRASCAGFNVPVEIKKNSHPDLWTAIRRQLIAKYTTDQATSGYGIYLVLWFGAKETKPPPDGKRPLTPEALRQRLEQDLTPDESRKISVIVMDVTKPGQTPLARARSTIGVAPQLSSRGSDGSSR